MPVEVELGQVQVVVVLDGQHQVQAVGHGAVRQVGDAQVNFVQLGLQIAQ